MIPSNHKLPVRAILGRGRSGTTWIGRVLSRYPHAIYKYEPFNSYKNNAYCRFLNRLAGELSTCSRDALVSDFFSACALCLHDVDFPPFPPKPSRRNPFILRVAWQLGKLAPRLRFAYENVGVAKPSQRDNILIKQVNFPNELLEAFHAITSCRTIAVIRNPMASVAASQRFYRESGRSPWRDEGRVRDILALGHAPSLSRYMGQLSSLDPIQFEALTWVIQTDPLARFAMNAPTAMIQTHEEWCLNPTRSASRAFKHFGWAMSPEVSLLIERTTSGDGAGSLHGVKKDPAKILNRWRSELDTASVRKLVDIANCSSAFEAHWPDLWSEVNT